MSDLTLCLITKGRAEYLNSLLESLDTCLKYEQVKVLVILNGVEAKIATQFKEWSQNYPAKVKLLKYENNDARFSRFWPTILDVNTKWISFPSDDDILNDSFLNQWEMFDRSYSNVGAIATSLELIGPNGSKLGITRDPSFNPQLSLVESTARAFSECPFLWPGLIVQVSALPRQIPDSRYVMDWWIGIFLLLTTKVELSKSILVNYRVHEGQESSMASMSRKNLEALTHLGSIINDEVFAAWIKVRSSSEIIEFLQYSLKYPPIYGDLKFSSELVSIMTRRVANIRQESDVLLTSFLVNAYSHDVLIIGDQLKYLGFNGINSLHSGSKANFNLKFGEGVCAEAHSILDEFVISSVEFPTIVVGCRHSKLKRGYVNFDCSKIRSRCEAQDRFVLQAEELLKMSEIFHGSVSPFEYNLIRIFRRIKASVPVWLNRKIYTRMRG